MSAADIQALLRFLSSNKVPLALAMSKVKDLQNGGLDTPAAIAKSNLETLKSYFPDEKMAKGILNAAKRASKKRTSDGALATPTTPTKRRKADPFETPATRPPAEVEESLDIQSSSLSADDLQHVAFVTNRAPLVLAFAVTLIKFTMPEQPPSSRFSLAQAVVSMGAQSKAKKIGISTGTTAEEEGWGQGQPVIKVMGRDISVLKRWGYEWREKSADYREDGESENAKTDENPAFWGIDLEKMKQLNGPLTFSATSADTAGLPVYSPQAARSYLFRSFDSAPAVEQTAESPQKSKKKTAAMMAAEREQNVGALLRALELLFESWSSTLDTVELDKRAWSWYVHVRPAVENGVAGWGAKGLVKLADILDLRRKT